MLDGKSKKQCAGFKFVISTVMRSYLLVMNSHVNNQNVPLLLNSFLLLGFPSPTLFEVFPVKEES